MFTPKVSIIVPVYNLEDYIEQTVRSLIAQTYKNIEVILIDDGSKDKSLSIIKRLASEDSRIIYTTQNNGGTAKARNTGLKFVTGEFITFVDGDDMLSNNAISDNIDYLKDDNIDWVAFSAKRVDSKGQHIEDKYIYKDFIISNFERISSISFIPYYYERKLSGVVCGAIYRKSSIEHISFVEGKYYEDSIYFIDLLCNTQNAILSPFGEYLYVDREGSSQKADLDYEHLESKEFCLLRRMTKFRALHPEFEDYYSKQENEYYYFLKNEVSKNTIAAEYFFNKFKKEMKAPLKINITKELKYYIYKHIGYKSIKKLFTYICK